MGKVTKFGTAILGAIATLACLATVGIIGYSLTDHNEKGNIQKQKADDQIEISETVDVLSSDKSGIEDIEIKNLSKPIPPVSDVTAAPVHTHDYVESIDIKATRYQEGRLKYECSICGDTYYTDLPIVQHYATPEWTIKREPTPELVGLRVKYCIYCDEIVAIEDIPYGHSGDSGQNGTVDGKHVHEYTSTIEREATCILAGLRKYTCSCGAFYTEPISAPGHVASDWTTVEEPTTTRLGRQQITCKVCGVIIDSRPLPVKEASASPSSSAAANATQTPAQTTAPVSPTTNPPAPTKAPNPTSAPSAVPKPTTAPTPTKAPTPKPTATPRTTPTPTIKPTITPTARPTPTSSIEPSVSPTPAVLPSAIPTTIPTPTPAGTVGLEVHFVNVGQGDCILITCDGENMLIDAGDNSKGTAVQRYLNNQGVSELKYVIATHPDADHIGGMDVIITKFNCGLIFMPDVENDTKTYQKVLDAMKYRGYQKTVPVVGDIYQLGGAEFQIVSPALTYSKLNNNSIVIRLAYGNNSFLFTGDAEVQAQQEMTYGGYTIQSDVMKIPHHGAVDGFQKWFYNEVKPAYAVISCGKGNSYGHPHEEVLAALRELGISVFRTDEQGDIIAYCDGQNPIRWNNVPIED